MSTQSEINAQIATIDDGGSNTAAEVRNVYTVLSDNFYGLKTTDTNASTNVFTEDNTNKAYTVATTKQGGLVKSRWTMTNNTGAVTGSNTVWATITTTEYQQQSSSPVYVVGQTAATGENVRFLLTTNVLASIDPIAPNETINLNLDYYTNA